MSPQAFELMALRRVSEGEITVADGGYTHCGRPVTGELAEALVRLHTAGYLTIEAPELGGHRPVQTTAAGADHRSRGGPGRRAGQGRPQWLSRTGSGGGDLPLDIPVDVPTGCAQRIRPSLPEATQCRSTLSTSSSGLTTSRTSTGCCVTLAVEARPYCGKPI